MAYFQQYESRAPDTSSVFVCRDCRYVYDDFSGEKKSMAGDTASFCKVCGPPHVVNYFGYFGAALNRGVVHAKNAPLLDKTDCLSCTKNPLGAVDAFSFRRSYRSSMAAGVWVVETLRDASSAPVISRLGGMSKAADVDTRYVASASMARRLAQYAGVRHCPRRKYSAKPSPRSGRWYWSANHCAGSTVIGVRG